jgi:hypothetical protein
MKAQILYDWREDSEFCSGSELSEFFASACGEPSPSGHVEIDSGRAVEFVNAMLDKMENNSPSAYAEIAHLRGVYR